MSLVKDLSELNTYILQYIEIKYGTRFTHLNIMPYTDVNDTAHMKVFASKGHTCISERDDPTYYHSKVFILPADLLEKPAMYIQQAKEFRDRANEEARKALHDRIMKEDLDKATTLLSKYMGPADLKELMEKVKD